MRSGLTLVSVCSVWCDTEFIHTHGRASMNNESGSYALGASGVDTCELSTFDVLNGTVQENKNNS